MPIDVTPIRLPMSRGQGLPALMWVSHANGDLFSERPGTSDKVAGSTTTPPATRDQLRPADGTAAKAPRAATRTLAHPRETATTARRDACPTSWRRLDDLATLLGPGAPEVAMLHVPRTAVRHAVSSPPVSTGQVTIEQPQWHMSSGQLVLWEALPTFAFLAPLTFRVDADNRSVWAETVATMLGAGAA